MPYKAELYKAERRNMEYIKTSKDGHVGIITMSHAPINVLTFDMLDEMSEALAEFGRDNDVWCIVLHSDQKIFAAGVDIKNLQKCDSEGNYETSSRIQKVFRELETFPHPVICAIHGNCMGGGIEMALSCDIRVFDPKVKAAFTECGLGICTGAGGSQRLTKLVGTGKAKRLIYTGEMLSAQSAYDLGICEYISEDGMVFEKAMEVAQLICTKGPKGVACAKKCIEYAAEHDLVDGLEYENRSVSDLFKTEDKQEGIAAFFEKRKPVFKNK